MTKSSQIAEETGIYAEQVDNNEIKSRLTSSQSTETNTEISLKYILSWAILLGLCMNWLGMYLKISMGFVSVGIGPMAVLLIARQILNKNKGATRENLTIVVIAYGATSAAEASIGLLFLLWLTANASFFGLTFSPPWWLLPSAEVISNRTLLSPEWIVPLMVHYGLMIIPGILGLVFGWYMKDMFIHDDDAYPFPGMISQTSQVGVLTDESETKGPLFWKITRIGFIAALITVLIPSLYIIDFSNLDSGIIIGLMLGPVGIALLAAGIIIGKSKITVGSMFTSILAYSVLSFFLLAGKPTAGNNFYDIFNNLLQKFYFVPALALLIGGLILGPIVWGIVSSIFANKPANKDINENSEEDTSAIIDGEILDASALDQASRFSLLKILIVKKWKLLLVFASVYVIMVVYVQSLQIIPTAPLWMISLLIFWNIIIGGMINGYLVTVGTAKSNSAISPPFVFDVLPIFLAGGAGFTSYVAMPTAETDGSAGIISSQKLAKMNGISSKIALVAYLAGYLATSITTPLFALFMWRAFGIGTPSFPAPAFPVQGAILASFASRDVTSFINVQQFILLLILAILLSKLGSDIIFGVALGLLFPPHMAVAFAIGGLIRVAMDRYYKEGSKEKAATIGPALSVGASFVIPILIILAFI